MKLSLSILTLAAVLTLGTSQTFAGVGVSGFSDQNSTQCSNGVGVSGLFGVGVSGLFGVGVSGLFGVGVSGLFGVGVSGFSDVISNSNTCGAANMGVGVSG